MKKLNYLPGLIVLFGVALLSTRCKNQSEKQTEASEKIMESKASVEKSDYGVTPEGEKVALYKLLNANGMEVQVITYGGRITSWTAPDREGNYEDVVLGFGSLENYVKDNPFFGALIGRYGNRIANGKFSLDGTEYTLAANNGANHLHGGVKGFDKVVWKAEEVPGVKGAALKLTYVSKDMEEGYPGTLTATVVYTLTDDDALRVEYEAETDKKTIVNLTQHSYFNLSGDFGKTILDHEVMLHADGFLPVNEGLIPTGEVRKVEGTPFDFTKAKPVGEAIGQANEQLKRGGGYDHCWVLNEQGKGMRTVATAYHPESGRLLEVVSDEPGIQFYTGNFLDGTLPAKSGGTYAYRSGFCLETQHYPDTPNQKGFPSVVLEPGEKYRSETVFKFSSK